MKLVLANEGKVPFELWPKLSKRDYYYLEKWNDQGYWKYGVSARAGWLEESGRDYFTKCVTEKVTKDD